MSRGYPSVQRIPLSQGAAGTLVAVAAPGAKKRIIVLGFSIALSVAGTAKWQSAANDKTGATNLNGGTPWSAFGRFEEPVIECNENEALNLVTVTGAGNGFLVYRIEGD